jgi:hypothetical protein
MPRSAYRVPDAPRSLARKDAEQLSAHTEAALRRQRRALAASIDSALGFIPLPLRIPVRKVLGL